jgi:hypothetical protein
MMVVQHDRAWGDTVTLDEPWFCLTTRHEFIWLPQREKVPERGGHTIQSKRFTSTFIWNPRVFHAINVLEKGRKFKVMHYITELLAPLSEWCASDAPERDRIWIVHADHARPHIARPSVELFEVNRMKTAPRPPYSPDITLSEFCPFYI